MDDNGTNKEINIDAGPVKLKAKGYHLGNLLQMLIAALLMFGVYMFIEMQREAKTTWKEMASATKAEHSALAVSIDRQTEAQEEMNYILTLSPTERERLNLSMPRSLRDKIVRGRQ